MIRKQRKTRQKRGAESHSGLRRRGSGSRGGFGNAGQGKKARAQKKTKMLAMGLKLGKYGFTNKNKTSVKTINLGDLMKQVKGSSVNATELGYDKVLGKGEALKGVTVTAKYFTKIAKEKIEKAKGKTVVM
ncbi:MAG TPA: uL15m family ribosomal protein [Candidatus Nanoarchaeia archaeon]|nr:uL15m family ribosomal protein [Candidatus Nanoarchaeia archaeon]